MSIRPYTSEYTAVYLGVYGRILKMGGQVYGRILAVYGRILGVYGRIPWVYGRIYTRYTAVSQDHGTGWVRGMHATLASNMFLVQTPLPSNMQKHV